MTSSPPAYRTLVGGALRRSRENIGYSLADAARILDCDRSKISRIETGHRGIRPKELRELLTEYDVPQAEQDALVGLARSGSRRSGWRNRYANGIPDPFADYLLMEAAATGIMIYDPHLVPDLLQTAAYADAVAEAQVGNMSGTIPNGVVKAERLARVLDGKRHLAVVLGEAALHQLIGGPEVMTAQFAHLTELIAGYPQLTLQVLPFAAGAHAASTSGPLTILQFGDVPAMSVVQVGDLSGGTCLTDPELVTCHIRAFAAARAEALSITKSRQLLTKAAGQQPGAVLAGNALMA
jgi:transcriptional regulator with XRE-family HTH domain